MSVSTACVGSRQRRAGRRGGAIRLNYSKPFKFWEALGNIQPKQGVLVPPTAVGAWAFPANATSVYLRSCCHGST